MIVTIAVFKPTSAIVVVRREAHTRGQARRRIPPVRLEGVFRQIKFDV